MDPVTYQCTADVRRAREQVTPWVPGEPLFLYMQRSPKIPRPEPTPHWITSDPPCLTAMVPARVCLVVSADGKDRWIVASYIPPNSTKREHKWAPRPGAFTLIHLDRGRVPRRVFWWAEVMTPCAIRIDRGMIACIRKQLKGVTEEQALRVLSPGPLPCEIRVDDDGEFQWIVPLKEPSCPPPTTLK